MNIQKFPIEKLKTAKYNPRKKLKPKDTEFEKLKNSIETFGLVDPIIVNTKSDYTVVGGHQRLSVVKHLGWKEVDCVLVELDENQEKALNIALNKIGGSWDESLLTDLLKDLKISGFDVSLTGFEAAEIADLLGEPKAEVEEDNFDLTPPQTTNFKLGDMFLLGRHKLLIGDSTDINTVKILMNDEKAQMVFTDLPWNIDYGKTRHPSYRKRTILNDNMSDEKFIEFMNKAFSCIKEVILPGAILYSVMGMVSWAAMDRVLKELEYHYSCCITWAKDTHVMSQGDYHKQTEMIWYGWLKGASRLCPLTDRKQSDLWNIPRPKRSDQHPMCKPLALVARALQNSSHIGDLVIDFFAGSGSTLISAEQTGRKCYSIELDPLYAELIVKRYINMTNNSDDVFLLRDGEKIKYCEIKEWLK